jgi:hypothetical protein
MKRKISLLILISIGIILNITIVWTFNKNNSKETPTTTETKESIEILQKEEVATEKLNLEKNKSTILFLEPTPNGMKTAGKTTLPPTGYQQPRNIEGESGIYIRGILNGNQIFETVDFDPNDFPIHKYELSGKINNATQIAQPIPLKLPPLPTQTILEIYKIRGQLDQNRKNILLLKRYALD